jgi:thioredoxin
MSKPLVLDADTFGDAVSDDESVLVVVFWAPWCRPCREFVPVFDAVADSCSDVLFARVNVEEAPTLAAERGIQAVPTTMVFRGGTMMREQVGAMSASSLQELVELARSRGSSSGED